MTERFSQSEMKHDSASSEGVLRLLADFSNYWRKRES